MKPKHPISTQPAKTEALEAVRRLLNHDTHQYSVFGSQPPRTLLLSGPPGIGKTKAVRTAAQEKGFPIFSVAPGPQVCHAIRSAFKSALGTASGAKRKTEPSSCIVFIDEIDTICPAPTSATIASSMNTATALLLSFIDPHSKTSRDKAGAAKSTIFMIAATNRADALHPSLRRTGRFARELMLRPPSVSERCDILCALEPSVERSVLYEVATRAVGFVVSDLVALCSSARSFGRADLNVTNDLADDEQFGLHNFSLALKKTRPSVLRSAIAAEAPATSWDDVGGLDDVKRRLKMAVEWPLLHADTFERLGLKAPRGILLHGPPGCSKTTLVRAAASQGHASFIRLNGADIYSCYLGEAERILREGFAMARAAAPCVLFLDEIDAVVGKRSIDGGQTDGNGVQERVLSTLLTEMDGVVSATGVLVIGATNRVDLLDDALLRPGRFDDILEVDMPDEAARLEILLIHTSKMPLGDDVNLSWLAERTVGKSGADLKSICAEAGLAAIREVYLSEEAKGAEPSLDIPKLFVASRHFEAMQGSNVVM